MKKLGKFIFGTLSIATLAAGAYYFYKNFINKDSSDDFDDFEDDLEDFDTEDDDVDGREYVSIHISSDNDSDAEAEDSVIENSELEQEEE